MTPPGCARAASALRAPSARSRPFSRDAAAVRAELIAAGTIRPGLALTPLRLPPSAPVLRMDAAGRKAAERHLAERHAPWRPFRAEAP